MNSKLLLLLLVVIYFKDVKADRPRESNGSSFTSKEANNDNSKDTNYSCIYDYSSCYSFADLLVNVTCITTLDYNYANKRIQSLQTYAQLSQSVTYTHNSWDGEFGLYPNLVLFELLIFLYIIMLILLCNLSLHNLYAGHVCIYVHVHAIKKIVNI